MFLENKVFKNFFLIKGSEAISSTLAHPRRRTEDLLRLMNNWQSLLRCYYQFTSPFSIEQVRSKRLFFSKALRLLAFSTSNFLRH
ncbi:unnamed protein product [Enterobius vermicularis]|uniref:NR LBD domain-containing protein n=1 Tax=Enterobius vermicularis TaxID=51028 RepID=A0A0N4USV0_ENTVE|nr:unnamed protein product [Enterobius vermicularis]